MNEPAGMGPVIATWMYSAPEGDQSMHHQVGKDIGSQKTRNYYWRCVFVLFASVARHLPSARRILIVNRRPPEMIDGVSTAGLLERFNIEVRVLEQVTRPGKDYHSSWNTQFIVIDALKILSEIATGDQPVLLLDSDCIFIRPLSTEILSRIGRKGILRYTLHDDDDIKENGLSNRDLAQLAAEYDPPLQREVIRYTGGEIFCARGDLLTNIVEVARGAYEQSIQRHSAGLPKFNEEAHLLSYVYELLGGQDHSANDFIKRIWTDRGVYSNVTGDETALTIWHLPAEKKTGILRAYRQLGRGLDFPGSVDGCARQFHVRPSAPALLGMRFKQLARWLRNLIR